MTNRHDGYVPEDKFRIAVIPLDTLTQSLLTVGSRERSADLWSSGRNWELLDRPGASVTLRCSIDCSDLLEGNCSECREILLAWKSVQLSVKTVVNCDWSATV